MTTDEAKAYADSKNILYFEVSAKAALNITVCLHELAKRLTGIETDPI